tara:strand:- start:202 stop:501 length:300 start_codon:yes stop_codon:yes gene_type:complete
MRKSKSKSKRITFDEAKSLVQSILSDRSVFLGINWNNFKKSTSEEGLYQITMEKMSLDALVTMLDDPRIKNVFFHPSVAPPGSGVDGIALRYRVYFEFN